MRAWQREHLTIPRTQYNVQQLSNVAVYPTLTTIPWLRGVCTWRGSGGLRLSAPPQVGTARVVRQQLDYVRAGPPRWLGEYLGNTVRVLAYVGALMGAYRAGEVNKVVIATVGKMKQLHIPVG